MRSVYLIIVVFHGLVHFAGFARAYGITDINELTLPISKSLGVAWMTASLLFLLYGTLHVLNSRYSWVAGMAAVVVSQVLIVYFWKDARWGSIPNLLILINLTASVGQYAFNGLIRTETKDLLGAINPSCGNTIARQDLDDLPEPVRKWLLRSGVVGRPWIDSGKVIQKAEMKMKPGQQKWMQARAVQYSTIDPHAFIWSVEAKLNPLLGFQGRDKFVDGQGEMVIKLNSLFSIVNEKGEKLNEGTLQRYLGEMVWFPTLALSRSIAWETVDDTTARANMSYRGTNGSGTFFFNAEGDFIRFSALRYMGNDPDALRHEWVLTVEEHSLYEGIKVPSKMKATWKLPTGDWTWLRLEITGLHYNVRDGDL